MDENANNTAAILPVFIKHSDMGLTMQQQVNTYDICKELFKVVDQETIRTVQRVRGLWRIYLKTEDARMKLMVQGFCWKSRSVRIYDKNPYHATTTLPDPSIKTVKVIISNLPESVENNEIEAMLKRMGCKIEAKLREEFIRDDDGKITSIRNGNRSILVEEEHIQSNPLPRFAFCGNWKCNIFYRNQPRNQKRDVTCYHCGQVGHTQKQCKNERQCKACHQYGHIEGTENCLHYKENEIHAFAGSNDKLSNFYPCEVKMDGRVFTSGEQAYAHAKAIHNKRPDIAAKIIEASNAREVKQESNKIKTDEKWSEIKVEVMEEVLRSKIDENDDIKQHLIDTGDMDLAEAVIGENFWGSGLPKKATANTDPEKWPGENMLGKMWMKMRDNLKEQSQKHQETEQEQSDKKRKASSELDNKTTSKQRKGDIVSSKTSRLSLQGRRNSK